ncbi:testis anion transporter 1 [Lissotriton helveticus]
MMSELLQNLNTGQMFNTTNLDLSSVNSSYAFWLMKNNTDHAILQQEVMALTASTTFLAGIMQLVLGCLNVGAITTYFSEIMMNALLAAATILVLISQIAFILGIPLAFNAGPMSIFYNLQHYFNSFPDTNTTSVLIFVICLFFLWLSRLLRFDCRYFSCHLPVEFFLIVIFAVVTKNLPNVAKMHRPGYLPMTFGFPTPTLPTLAQLDIFMMDALFLALVSYFLLLSMAKMFALKHGYVISNNQELIAVGICNIVGSIFRGFPVSCTLSRTIVQEKTGGSSQIAGLIAASIMLIIVLNLGLLLQNMPEAVLAAIVVSNLLPLLDNLHLVPQLWIQDKYDFSIWVVTFMSCVVLGLAFGLAIALVFSLFTICIRTHSTKIQLIGQIPETNIYRNFIEYPETLEVACVKIFQCCSSIYFANMMAFFKNLTKMAGLDPQASEVCRLQTSVKRYETDRPETETKCALMDYCTLCIQSQNYHTFLLGERFRRSPGVPLTSATDCKSCQRPLALEDEAFLIPQLDMAAGPLERECIIGPGSAGHRDMDTTSIKTNSVLFPPSRQTSDIKIASESEAQGPSKFHTIVLDFSMVQFIDSVAVRLLSEIWYMFKEYGITLLIASCPSSVMADLERNHFFDNENTKAAVFISVHDAVLFASGWDLSEEKSMALKEAERRRAVFEDEGRCPCPSNENTEETPFTENVYIQTHLDRNSLPAQCQVDTTSDVPGVDVSSQSRGRGMETDSLSYNY